MWESELIELGRVKEGTKHFIPFTFKEPLPEDFKILDMKSSCGCSVPKEESFGISVEYKAGNVPPQLLTKGEYTTTKRISIKTSEGDFMLEFRVTVFK